MLEQNVIYDKRLTCQLLIQQLLLFIVKLRIIKQNNSLASASDNNSCYEITYCRLHKSILLLFLINNVLDDVIF